MFGVTRNTLRPYTAIVTGADLSLISAWSRRSQTGQSIPILLQPRWEIRNSGLRLNKPTGWNTIPSVIGYLVKIRVLNLTPFIEITYQKGPRKNCSIEFCYWKVFSSFVPKLNRLRLELTWSNRFKPVICCSILVLMYRMLNIPFF